MFGKLGFYIKHSFNDLRVNGQRTVFALLCIAAGVAAIVSLQTLAVMISDTLTGNLQANNRGDIQFQPPQDFGDDETIVQQGIDSGVLVVEEYTFFGQTSNGYYVSEAGVQNIQDWADTNFPNQIQLTYNQPLDNPITIFFGNGRGGSMTDPESGNFVSQISAIVVDTDVYPFYSDVETLDGTSLSDAITSATDIVLSEKIAEDLGADVGTVVRLNGSDADFTVTGIVETGTEVKNPGADIFNAFFGFYYLDQSAVPLFEDVNPQATFVYVQLANPTPELVNEFNEAFTQEYPYLLVSTTEDLRESYETISSAVEDLVTVMGLISMLIGSIGIINTMQVIVRRRTVEVAVLKTIGLQAGQVTNLFLVEAVIMGIIGSILGILLGLGATFFIKGAAESFVGNDLPFQFVPSAAINGFIIGVIVTTVFGFLPTLSAGQVRPGLVLRPSSNLIPRAGILRTIFALLVILGVLSGIAFTILSDPLLSIAVVVGSFFAVIFLYVTLWTTIWFIAKFTPSFGFIDLKISLKQMNAGRSRTATTLLALVIGVFSLSLVTLLAQAVTNVLEFALEEQSGGNVAVTLQNQAELDTIEEIINNQEGVNNYQVVRNYGVNLVSFEDVETGDTISLDIMRDRVSEISFNPFSNEPEELSDQEINERMDILLQSVGTIDSLPVEDFPVDDELEAGRLLTAEDLNSRVLVLATNQFMISAGITNGDVLNFEIGDTEEIISFEIVGVEPESIIGGGFNSPLYAPAGAFPETLAPSGINVIVDIDEEFVPEFRREMLTVPGAFVIETALLVELINNLLGTFTAFPTMVAFLGLLVGGVVIANSVALTTMERRREIAVMKAVGLQRERVLGMILLENGVMGLIGGLIGVGNGLIGLVLLVSTFGIPSSQLPYATAFLLMGLCIIVALVASVTTAWGASGEKPLNVLRYE